MISSTVRFFFSFKSQTLCVGGKVGVGLGSLDFTLRTTVLDDDVTENIIFSYGSSMLYKIFYRVAYFISIKMPGANERKSILHHCFNKLLHSKSYALNRSVIKIFLQ